MRRIVATLVVLVALSLAARGGEEAATIEVTATGIGVDANAAMKSALKNAVELAMGTLIDSKTMIENDEVIEDKILAHSGGYVEKHRITEGPTASEGMVTVTIEASVKRTQLMSQLETQNIIASKKIDGLSMGGESFTKQEDNSAAMDMLRELVKGFPESYVKIELDGEPHVDKSGKKVIVNIKNSIDKPRLAAFIAKMETFLEQAAVRKRKTIRTKLKPVKRNGYDCLEMDGYRMQGLAEKDTDSPVVVLMTRVSDDNSLAMWKSYNITTEMNKIIYDARDNRPSLRVEVIDSSGEVIETKKYSIDYPYSRYKNHWTAWHFYPFSNGIEGDKYLGPVDGVLNLVVEFDTLFPDEISDIREIKLSLDRP